MKAESTPANGLSAPLPGARQALVLLLLINLFNYIDRQVLAAVVPQIKETLLRPERRGHWGDPDPPAGVVPEPPGLQAGERADRRALDGVHGGLHDRRAGLRQAGRAAFALGADRRRRHPLEPGQRRLRPGRRLLILLLTRCFVGIGEAAYGPVAPTLISDFYPVKVRGRVLAWFYMAIPVGSALGYVLGDAVAARASALGA